MGSINICLKFIWCEKKKINKMILLCLITVVLRTTRHNAVIDNSPNRGKIGGEKVKCAESQSTEVLHWEHLKIGDFLYRNRKKKLFLASIVHYLRNPCLFFRILPVEMLIELVEISKCCGSQTSNIMYCILSCFAIYLAVHFTFILISLCSPNIWRR